MKKALTAVLVLLFLSALGACKKEPAQPNIREDAFTVAVKNNCTSDIYGLHFEYYLGAAPTGGGGVRYAKENTPIAQGDILTREFLPKDFPEGADLTGFSIEIFVILKDESEIPAGMAISIPAVYGETYSYTLTGSADEGFTLSETK